MSFGPLFPGLGLITDGLVPGGGGGGVEVIGVALNSPLGFEAANGQGITIDRFALRYRETAGLEFEDFADSVLEFPTLSSPFGGETFPLTKVIASSITSETGPTVRTGTGNPAIVASAIFTTSSPQGFRQVVVTLAGSGTGFAFVDWTWNGIDFFAQVQVQVLACPRVDAWYEDSGWLEVGRAIRFQDGVEKEGIYTITLENSASRFRLVEDEPEVSRVRWIKGDGQDWGLGEIVTRPGTPEKPGTVLEFSFPEPILELKTFGYYDRMDSSVLSEMET